MIDNKLRRRVDNVSQKRQVFGEIFLKQREVTVSQSTGQVPAFDGCIVIVSESINTDNSGTGAKQPVCECASNESGTSCYKIVLQITLHCPQ